MMSFTNYFTFFPTPLFFLVKISPFTREEELKVENHIIFLSFRHKNVWSVLRAGWFPAPNVKSICYCVCVSLDSPLSHRIRAQMPGICTASSSCLGEAWHYIFHLFFIKVFFIPLRIFPNHIKFMIPSAKGTTNTKREPNMCICITCTKFCKFY